MTNPTLSNDHWKKLARQATGASAVAYTESVQSLWSGYGEIFRARLTGANTDSLIVKHVAPPIGDNHPRGWDSDFATRRKLASYQIEANWYRHWSKNCNSDCRVAQCYGTDQIGKQSWILLEDLDAAGFGQRFTRLNSDKAADCLRWLAHFHATFLGYQADTLWPIGTYWHLETRPDELSAMTAGPIRDQAHVIDAMLNNCRYQTLVHGDAKVANFCFSPDSTIVAAVDFQYVGGGCGMKDVAYFIGSCLNENECEQYIDELLNGYFSNLQSALEQRASKTGEVSWDFTALEREWRQLYAVAWTDFYRFLLGWMPTHQKIHCYTEQLAKQTLQLLDGDD